MLLASLSRFFANSDSMALTSRSVAEAVKSGSLKKLLKRCSDSRKAPKRS